MANYKLSGKHTSVWMDTTKDTSYPPLSKESEFDVVVIGAGIAGLNTAFRLKSEGKKVAVIDRGKIASSVSGHTTAHISSAHSLIYDRLSVDFGERAKIYADANQYAISEYERIIKQKSINCDFKRVDTYIFIEDEKRKAEYENEYNAALKFELPVTWVNEAPLPFKNYGAIKYSNQAQFHPRKYLQSLAKLIDGQGSVILENTKAIDIKEDKDSIEIITENGNLRAKNAVMTTHSPFLIRGNYFLKVEQYSSYVLGVYLKKELTRALFDSSDHYIRTFDTKEGQLVIIGGEDHKVGQEKSTLERYEVLEQWVRDYLPVKRIAYQWCTQDNYSPEEVPLIGPYGAGYKRLFVATGFKGWGMTHGMVTSKIITDCILKKDNPWLELYSPDRKTSLRTKFWGLQMNVNTAQATITGVIKKVPERNIENIKEGNGKVILTQDKKMAVYKDTDGMTHAVSAKCTHMGCIVGWNNAEQSWDCPCHGSRYTQDGKVIYGPALKNLEPYKKISK